MFTNLAIERGPHIVMWIKQCHKPSPNFTIIGSMVTIRRKIGGKNGIVLATLFIKSHDYTTVSPVSHLLYHIPLISHSYTIDIH